MFSVMQEGNDFRKLWPGIQSVDATYKPGWGTPTCVTAVGGPCGVIDFRPSRKTHTIYVMNESGSTVARYDLGNDPTAEVAGTLPPSAEPVEKEAA